MNTITTVSCYARRLTRHGLHGLACRLHDHAEKARGGCRGIGFGIGDDLASRRRTSDDRRTLSVHDPNGPRDGAFCRERKSRERPPYYQPRCLARWIAGDGTLSFRSLPCYTATIWTEA